MPESLELPHVLFTRVSGKHTPLHIDVADVNEIMAIDASSVEEDDGNIVFAMLL